MGSGNSNFWRKKINTIDLIQKKLLPVECIIPAAGFSSRMDDWKIRLKDKNGKTFLQGTVEKALGVCEKVILVGGYRFEELKHSFEPHERLVVIENPGYAGGMLSSIQRGLLLVEKDFFITPVDMPALTGEHYRILYSLFDAEHVLRPVFRGQPGHPILCPYGCRKDILELKGDRLIKALRHWDTRKAVWEDSSVVADIDTPEEYAAWISSNS